MEVQPHDADATRGSDLAYGGETGTVPVASMTDSADLEGYSVVRVRV